jgi:trehalose 6-phosphate synthase
MERPTAKDVARDTGRTRDGARPGTDTRSGVATVVETKPIKPGPTKPGQALAAKASSKTAAGGGRLVIVANRLPVHRAKQPGGKGDWQISPGGLVTAMRPVLTQCKGCWVGWAGGAEDVPEGLEYDGISLRSVRLSKSELDSFYTGFSNRTLWPLYHDGVRTPEFRRRWWRQYVEVNRRFADATAAALSPGDMVWVHDYHLQLAPAMIRERCPGVRIGFFLHIPFPAQELFARLPWRREILEGLLGSDVIGFQTILGAQNFARSCRRFTRARGAGRELEFEGRRVRVGAFPISIDVANFERLAADPGVAKRRDQLRARAEAERRIVLGVDRLDYTKGIDVRLRAIEEVLRRGRLKADEFVFMQVAVPSRESAAEYVDMRSRIEELVGRINGEYGEPGKIPVQYMRRNLPHEDLAAYYLAADVMLVTPLRDGMNLVAKEYVATRTDNGGVLVLSEFTGAARELTRAILVNPFDIDGVASALEEAMAMDTAEARRRMMSMRRVLKRNDVYHWADSFLRALSG